MPAHPTGLNMQTIVARSLLYNRAMDSEPEILQEVANAVLILAKAVVDQPEMVRLEILARPTETLLRIHTSPTDTGKLIGSQGRTARSFRIILAAVAMKYRQHPIVLDIVEINERRDG